MKQIGLRQIRLLATSLALVLVFSLVFFGAQQIALGRASPLGSELASKQQMAAVLGGNQLLLAGDLPAGVYLPFVVR